VDNYNRLKATQSLEGAVHLEKLIIAPLKSVDRL
jgi:hypothetical protein